jgi:triphosphoribosyl-dephospho-CoA synthase
VKTIAEAYIASCLAELDALKPGNVHRHAAGHGMTTSDFEISARVSAPAIARAGARVGARVLGAVTATRAAVGQNTNLGILLLCAPLAAAAERRGLLHENLVAVLGELDLDDARSTFAAIATANPGGLGRMDRHDVRTAPTINLRDAMAAAADRDLVARQYVTDFEDVFGLGRGAYAEAVETSDNPSFAAESVYLGFLTALPDSHIARKFGVGAAIEVRDDAAARSAALGPAGSPERAQALAAWDAALKARGLNPGACADLTVATLFAAYLSPRTTNGLRRRRNND